MTERELAEIREQYFPFAVQSVEAEHIVNLVDEVERLREGLLDAYSNVKNYFGSSQDAYDTCQEILKVLDKE